MNKSAIPIAVLATAFVCAGGFGLYRLGLQQGMSQVGMAAITPAAIAPGATTVDPSSWGIPEGEAATRRHIESGLSGGDVDPVTGRSILYYHDPMVPGKKFESPGKSPFMDMMLVPAYSGASGGDTGTLAVSPRIQQNLGLRTGKVLAGQFSAELSAVGTVAWNERRLFVVQARATGYVEKLHVRAAFDRVAKDQPLLDLYVPDWVAVQEDYLAARRLQAGQLVSLIDAARHRMRQAGMSEAQIDVVERSGQIQPRLTVVAPTSGVVTELIAREGGTIMTGTPLMRINGLGSVWVHAELPESQAALITVGALVTAKTPALPGEAFRGRVQALLPEVDPITRTRKARMMITNRQGRLVPGMFVTMMLAAASSAPTLLAPSEALVRTGRRTLVIVVENGDFRPVEVQVGREQDGQAEILDGLSEGQQIVLSGQFLIDSEASLKGVEARMGTGAGSATDAALQQTYQTMARVEAVSGNTVTLTHPEIPALKWPDMTMDFILAPDASPSGLSAGSDIDITFRLRDDDMPLIVDWQMRRGKRAGDAR